MQRYLKPAKHSLMIMILCAALLLINIILPVNSLGIVPREVNHLSGIVFAPFLHADWLHLISNFLPFVILSSLIGLHSLRRFWMVFTLSILFTGCLVWLFARGGSIHIGMSGVVYAMWGYLIVYGFRQKHFRDVLIAVLVVILYGGLVFGVLPSAPNVSYESHFFGALVGGVLGYLFSKPV
ncbi:rhomboid family intramembrane serine protease [Psychromonas sp. RZ22]|uniref:rhomboid family intramembrane serine protease n=1 Tax=Psychromonas algarum TaxID=2555643 RepID=UPI001067AA11|nr:rhomboid family intramembrane serine protease [Psychromonas sp. RZ22]TEW54558.1 rhomboid family intramembrane serine protease [Psychromonas sp. RZ22]